MAADQELTLAEQAYISVHKDILTGELAPGDVVSERELAARYEMSKTPIREAVTQICREGLLQRLPGRGYMVSPITIKEIQDLFDLRLILEVAAVEKVIDKASPVLFSKLKAMAEISYVLDDPESHILFLEANRKFHLALAEGCGNMRIVRIMETLLNEMDRLFHLGLRLRDSSEEMTREHCELVAALENGDIETARKSTIEQIQTSKQRVLEAIMTGELKPIQAIG
jgi:DNA-binding GntR family transcriptional regulator